MSSRMNSSSLRIIDKYNIYFYTFMPHFTHQQKFPDSINLKLSLLCLQYIQNIDI